MLLFYTLFFRIDKYSIAIYEKPITFRVNYYDENMIRQGSLPHLNLYTNLFLRPGLHPSVANIQSIRKMVKNYLSYLNDKGFENWSAEITYWSTVDPTLKTLQVYYD